jgi:hypothetical protein
MPTVPLPTDPDRVQIPSQASDIFWLNKCDDEEVLHGCMYFMGILCHVYFIKVEDVNGVQTAVNDPHCRLEDIYSLDSDGAYKTVNVLGFEGEYVLVVHPGK